MLHVCFEPEAVGERMKGGSLMVHRAMRGGVVGTEDVHVEVEGSGSLDVHEGIYESSLEHRSLHPVRRR